MTDSHPASHVAVAIIGSMLRVEPKNPQWRHSGARLPTQMAVKRASIHAELTWYKFTPAGKYIHWPAQKFVFRHHGDFNLAAPKLPAGP